MTRARARRSSAHVNRRSAARRRATPSNDHKMVPLQSFIDKSGKISLMSWDRLGAVARARRKELGLTQGDVAARGGPSVPALRAIENNRTGQRLSDKLRQALERSLGWDAGSVEAILDGGAPRALPTLTATDAGTASTANGPTPAANAAERFAMAEHLIKMRRTFAAHRDAMAETARMAIEEDFANAAREMEDAMGWMLPWLGDEERTAAIRILSELHGE